MKKLKYVLLLLFALQLPAFAADQKPSEASIRELLSVTKASKLYDSMITQVDTMTRLAVQQSLKGKILSAEEQKIIDRMREKMVGVVKQTISWEQMEAMYIRVYRDAFTQKELDGMLAFYRTPAGQAVIDKLPTLMARVMQEVRVQMEAMKPGMQRVIQETLQEVKELEKQKTQGQDANKPAASSSST